jgi:DNA modification methylase
MNKEKQQVISVDSIKDIPSKTQEWGTFRDSLRAPIHKWFTYPAGFSYKAVEASFAMHGVKHGQLVYDPFMGTATTNLVAKTFGINSYGVEAHPFVFRIARTKMYWDVIQSSLAKTLEKIELSVNIRRNHNNGNFGMRLKKSFPELILKCYEENILGDLFFIREAIANTKTTPAINDILYVGLAALLREVSSAATGWPYIAPKKKKTTSLNKNALVEFSRIILSMGQDIETVRSEASPYSEGSCHKLFNADSRYTQKLIPSHSVDHVFTSPPYLNNFDYADRTRLELYFFGEAKTWGDISNNIRTKLITSATTQISRNDPKYILSKDIQKKAPIVYVALTKAINELGKVRLVKGGKKSYDHLVSGYFNDMFLVIGEVFRVLKSGKTAVFILGDSAPYGVHIPTEELLGKIGCAHGFKRYTTQQLRTRGDKWRGNTQRHHVALRESILTLYK